jgi:hypothetical protein
MDMFLGGNTTQCPPSDLQLDSPIQSQLYTHIPLLLSLSHSKSPPLYPPLAWFHRLPLVIKKKALETIIVFPRFLLPVHFDLMGIGLADMT